MTKLVCDGIQTTKVGGDSVQPPKLVWESVKLLKFVWDSVKPTKLVWDGVKPTKLVWDGVQMAILRKETVKVIQNLLTQYLTKGDQNWLSIDINVNTEVKRNVAMGNWY